MLALGERNRRPVGVYEISAITIEPQPLNL
jgi:hypothetical protein